MLKNKSWVMLKDGIFHCQKKGETLCGAEGSYIFFEDRNPTIYLRCMKCRRLIKSIN